MNKRSFRTYVKYILLLAVVVTLSILFCPRKATSLLSDSSSHFAYLYISREDAPESNSIASDTAEQLFFLMEDSLVQYRGPFSGTVTLADNMHCYNLYLPRVDHEQEIESIERLIFDDSGYIYTEHSVYKILGTDIKNRSRLLSLIQQLGATQTKEQSR